MGASPQKQQILTKLAENEAAVAKLYRAYARLFPKQENFWSGLANEEIKHAGLIKKIAETYADEVTVREDVFDSKLFELSAGFLAQKTEEASGTGCSLNEALSNSLDIETSMIERNFFQVFEGGSHQFTEGMQVLQTETGKHIDMVRSRLSKMRRSFF